jgi:hypothetical protein
LLDLAGGHRTPPLDGVNTLDGHEERLVDGPLRLRDVRVQSVEQVTDATVECRVAEWHRPAEMTLGYRLPRSYLDVLRIANGGKLMKTFFPTKKSLRVNMNHINGIGTEAGIDSPGRGTRDLPDGVVLSSDHELTFMLDYSKCGPQLKRWIQRAVKFVRKIPGKE